MYQGAGFATFGAPERLQAKACPGLDPGGNRFASRKPVKSGIWSPVSIRSKRKGLRGRHRACFEIHEHADYAGARGASCIVVSP